MTSSRNEDWVEIWKTASANTISLLEQIQLLKMASSRNEDWEGDMLGLPAEQPWQLEIFLLLIWPCETCTRSIYPNMLPLQWNFFPGSAIVSKVPTFWGIGNPTDIHGSWGTWLVSELQSDILHWQCAFQDHLAESTLRPLRIFGMWIFFSALQIYVLLHLSFSCISCIVATACCVSWKINRLQIRFRVIPWNQWSHQDQNQHLCKAFGIPGHHIDWILGTVERLWLTRWDKSVRW